MILYGRYFVFVFLPPCILCALCSAIGIVCSDRCRIGDGADFAGSVRRGGGRCRSRLHVVADRRRKFGAAAMGAGSAVHPRYGPGVFARNAPKFRDIHTTRRISTAQCIPTTEHRSCRSEGWPRNLVGHGGRAEMRRFGCSDRGTARRPARVGFYRHTAAGGGGGTLWRARIPHARKRPCGFERRTPTLAGGKPPFPAASIRHIGSGIARLVARPVPGARHAAERVGGKL